MYLQDFLGDPSDVLDHAFATAKLHPKKNPTTETAMRVIGDIVATGARDKIMEEVRIDLMDGVAMYEINNGEYEDISEAATVERDDYESGVDDAVEGALEKYDEHLSADWLGKNTIDTELWLDTEDDRKRLIALAKSAAKEIFKQITADKTPAQVLANAGITHADVEARLAQHTTEEGNNTMADAPALESVIEKIKVHVGKDFDQLAVYEDIETIVEDDDEVLVGSAASRLSIDGADVQEIQIAALDMDDAPTEIVAMIDNFKPKSAAAVKKEAKAQKAATKADSEKNGLPPSVFSALKECGAGDTVMADALGVSRSTYTNYVKGKTHLDPNGDQYGVIRDELIERTNKLLAALADVDGVEAMQVS